MKKDLIIRSLYIILLIVFVLVVNKLSSITMNNYKMNQPFSRNPQSQISVLSANVGNLDLGCRSVLNKLCYKDVEERIASNIQSLNPDIVILQEVLAPWQCAKQKEKDKNKVCFYNQALTQVRRLLGENYSIVCNSRNQFECVGVRVDIGNIKGCKAGEICNIARTIPEILGCDNGFTISAVTVMLLNGFEFDVINFHPQSTDTTCRAKMLKFAFEKSHPNELIIKNKNVLLAGDFNFDPWRDKDESVALWQDLFSQGWANKVFKYHSGIAEKNNPYYTSRTFFRQRTLDFIVSNFAEGTCIVLGETPETYRLDGGKGMDHRAIYGILNIDPEN